MRTIRLSIKNGRITRYDVHSNYSNYTGVIKHVSLIQAILKFSPYY